MNIESRMTPVKNLLDKVLIDQLFAEKKGEDLKVEKAAEQGIIEKRDFVELHPTGRPSRRRSISRSIFGISDFEDPCSLSISSMRAVTFARSYGL